MANANKLTLKDSIYQQMIEMICNGQFKSNEIITESQLISHFGTSKSPVREALIQLCHDNVLSSIPRCGYQVISISPNDIHKLTELRLFLELGNLQKIIETITPDQLNKLHHLNQIRQVPTAQKDIWSCWNNNVVFHTYLLECGENEYVIDAMQRAFSSCTRAYAQLYATQKDTIIQSDNHPHRHTQLANAIEQHDLDMAVSILRKDILCMESELLHAPNPSWIQL